MPSRHGRPDARRPAPGPGRGPEHHGGRSATQQPAPLGGAGPGGRPLDDEGAAIEDGPIAAIRDGDAIAIDVDDRRLDVALSDEEIARRLPERPAPRPACTRGVLARYARSVADASRGAVTDWLGRDEG